MITGGVSWRLWGHIGTRPSHAEQSTDSREYYYETFKPPLSARISLSPFICAWRQARKKFLPHEQRLSPTTTTTTSTTTFGFVCVVVTCLSHFSVWSTAHLQPGTMRCEIHTCPGPDTVVSSPEIKDKSLLFPPFPPISSSSFEELAEVEQNMPTHTNSVCLRRAAHFPAPFKHAQRKRDENSPLLSILTTGHGANKGKKRKDGKWTWCKPRGVNAIDSPMLCDVAVRWDPSSHRGKADAATA